MSSDHDCEVTQYDLEVAVHNGGQEALRRLEAAEARNVELAEQVESLLGRVRTLHGTLSGLDDRFEALLQANRNLAEKAVRDLGGLEQKIGTLTALLGARR